MLRWSSTLRRASRTSTAHTGRHIIGYSHQWRLPTAGQHSSVTRQNKSSTQPQYTSEDEFLDLIFGPPEGASDGSLEGRSEKTSEVPQIARKIVPRRELGSQRRPEIHVGRTRPQIRHRPVPVDTEAATSTFHPHEKSDTEYYTKIISFRKSADSGPRKKKLPSNWARLRSLSRPSDRYASAWQLNFHKLASRHDTRLSIKFNPDKKPQLNRLSPNAPVWTEWALEQANGETGTITPETLQRNCDGEDPYVVWYSIALSLLLEKPSRVVDFLLATYGPRPFPPFSWVQQCIQYLCFHYRRTAPPGEHERFEDLYRAVKVLVNREFSQETMTIEGAALRYMIAHMSPAQMLELFDLIRTRRLETKPLTLIHITRYLAHSGDLGNALDVLLEAKARGVSVNSYAFMSSCSTLLRQSLLHTNDLRLCSRLIDNFVNIGVKMDTQLANIVLLNAIEAQDLGTARDIWASMTANKVEPDHYTIAIMLKVCKKDPGDIELLKGLIHVASERGAVRENSLIANEILDCLMLHHWQFNPSNAFTAVLDAYLGLFDHEPLKELGIPLPPASVDALPSSARLAATPQALRAVIALYIQMETTDNVLALYQRWLDLVDSGQSLFVATATTTFIPNVFLMRFIRMKSSLVYAAQVVKDMQQRPLPPSAGAEARAVPDIRTWTIFLLGFMRHGQTELAEQVVTYMKKKGIEPDTVTWNTLLLGHCREQNVDKALDALREMRLSGHAFDAWTYRNLSRFSERNRVRLRRSMESKKFEEQMDFTREIQQEMGDRMTKFSPMAIHAK